MLFRVHKCEEGDMQEHEKPHEAWAECYKATCGTDRYNATEKELFDTVFSQLEQIQKQLIVEKITEAEARLSLLEAELDAFIAKKAKEAPAEG